MRIALEDIGPFLKDVRIINHWTQEGLAVAADVSQSTIHRLESGNLSVKLTTLAKVFIALGFGPDTRIELKGDLSCLRCTQTPTGTA